MVNVTSKRPRAYALRSVIVSAAMVTGVACGGGSFVPVIGGGDGGTTGDSATGIHTTPGTDAHEQGHDAAGSHDAAKSHDSTVGFDAGNSDDASEPGDADFFDASFDADFDANFDADFDADFDAGDDDAGPSCSGGADTCGSPDDCPNAPNACEDVTCNSGCCGTEDKASGTMCGNSPTGRVCDGQGDCVGCIANGNCPGSGTTCATPTCKQNTCEETPAPAYTACTDNGGHICNGLGKCVACTDQDLSACPVTGTTCSTPACKSNGTCTTDSAPTETACTDNGGKVCNGTGKCVACNTAADCPSGTVTLACVNNACVGL
jgi:hypothetical protein